jgi:hypothetical protein
MWLLASILTIATLSMARPIRRAFGSESLFLLGASAVMVVVLFQAGKLG